MNLAAPTKGTPQGRRDAEAKKEKQIPSASSAARRLGGWFFLLAVAAVPVLAQFHRAEQDREITYWLLAPASHQFLISHDLPITRPVQKYAHSFVRKGSKV